MKIRWQQGLNLGTAMTLLLLAGMTSSVNADSVKSPIWVGGEFSIYPAPNGLGLTEQKVFVNQATVAQNVDLTGSIGANNGAKQSYWVTTDAAGLEGEGNGFAIIKGGSVITVSDKGKEEKENALIHDITFGVYKSVFEDVEFSLLPVNEADVDFTVTGFFQNGTQESYALNTKNGLEDFLLLVKDQKNKFTKINISSTAGFEQTKQWSVSGVSAVPLPAAVWLFGSALLGIGGIGYRRQVKRG